MTRLPCQRLFRRSGLIGRPAEHLAAAFAQAGALFVHAGNDPSPVRNFRQAEPQDIAGAEPPLILLGKGFACCRQQRQAQGQAGHEREMSDVEPISSHHCPQKRPTLRSSARRFAALESSMMVLRRVAAEQDRKPLCNEISIECCCSALTGSAPELPRLLSVLRRRSDTARVAHGSPSRRRKPPNPMV
jgi:hypothetical protein